MMECVSAGDVSEAWWNEACKKVKNAAVFIDGSTAESLHWNGGLARLADAGAKNVKEFSSFEKGGEKDVKAVFLVSVALRGITATILQDIIQASNFHYCIVITAAHATTHTYARYGGREMDDAVLTTEMEQSILSWMGNMNYTVEIFHLPLVIVPYSEELFFLPVFASLYPLLSCDVPKISRHYQATARDKSKPINNLDEVEFHHLPHEMRVSMRQLVASIHSLLQGMNAREEIFTLGHTAQIIGTELDTFPPARQRRKMAGNKVSLVLVDRTLDLVGAADHSGDTLMDRLLSLLPRLPDHCIDSSVNMAPLSNLHQSCEWSLVPGCLAPQDKEVRSREVMKSLVTDTTKETLTLINKHVLEATSRKDVPPSSPRKEGKVMLETLKQNIHQFASDIDGFTENAALIQQGLGAIEALTDPKSEKQDQLLSVEKRLLQALADPEETSPFTQIFQLLRTRKSHGVSLDDLLSLMVYVASLGGPQVFTQREEYALINLLSHAIMEDQDNLSDLLLELVGEEVDEVSALKTAQNISRQLYAITATRQHLHKYKSIHDPGDENEPASYNSLLPRLVYDCLSSPQGEMTDLEYKSAGFKDLIKTGFSLFVNVSKPSPRDAPVMIVWVIGGVTPSEIRQVTRLVKALGSHTRLILASSHLAYSQETLHNVLQTNHFLRQL